MGVQRLPEEVRKYLETKENCMVLDVACGETEIPIEVRRMGHNYIGCDIKLKRGIDVRCDALNLPFKESSFDCVLTFATLEHLKDPFIFFREICRVLKNDGVVFGSSAFLEPFHENSYFHLSHKGLEMVLSKHFRNVEIRPFKGWDCFTAIYRMSYPEKLQFLAKMLGKVNYLLIIFVRKLIVSMQLNKKKRERKLKELEDDRYRYSGAFFFVCSNPKK